jgi:hypothetical protein
LFKQVELYKKELIDASCKVCSGGYTNASDPNYIKDFIAWGKLSYSNDRVTKTVIKFMKENKGERQGAFFLAESSSGIFNPAGAVIAGKIREKYGPFSRSEEESLKRSEEYKDVVFLNTPSVKQFADIVGESMFMQYHEGDASGMLSKIQSNKNVLKAVLNIEKSAKDNDKYIYGSLKKQLTDALVDVWIYTYGKESRPEKDKAYKLLTELGLL